MVAPIAGLRLRHHGQNEQNHSMTSFISPDIFDAAPRAWPFGSLTPGAYGLIMADPPWRFETYSELGRGKSAEQHYSTMTIEDIAALPIADLAAPDCLLWLWATAPMLHEQMRLLACWGFKFKTSGVWVKQTTHGKIAFGTGYILRNAHEPFLIATRGKPTCTRSVRSTGHSRKPAAAFAAAEALLPGARRVELFSRQNRPGWEAWGDQAGLLDEVVA